MSLSNDIFHVKCDLMPSLENTGLFIEARSLFQKKIASVLKENHMLTMVKISKLLSMKVDINSLFSLQEKIDLN